MLLLLHTVVSFLPTDHRSQSETLPRALYDVLSVIMHYCFRVHHSTGKCYDTNTWMLHLMYHHKILMYMWKI